MTTKRLPDGWRRAKLYNVCEQHTGTRDPHSEPAELFIYIDISSIDNGVKRIVEPKTLLGADAPSRARKVVHSGDVILSTTRPNLNAVAMVPSELDDQVCSTGFCVLRPKQDLLDSAYLYAFVQHPEFVNQLSRLVVGALYPAVTDRQVFTQSIPLPPLYEQKRIAAFLIEKMATIDQARAAAQARLEAAQALPAAYLRAVFNSPEARKWPQQPLGKISSVLAGITKGRKLKVGTMVYSVPYLRVANVQDGYLDLSEISYIGATESEIEQYSLKQGDLLLTEGGDPDKLGRGTFWESQIQECIYQNHIFRVRFNPEQVLPAFASAQIASPYGKAYFLANARQTTGIATINRTILSNFPLRIPSLAEQQCVVLAFAHFEKGFRDLNQRFFVQNCAIARYRFCPIWANKQRRSRSDCQTDFASYAFNAFLTHTVFLATQFSKLLSEISER